MAEQTGRIPPSLQNAPQIPERLYFSWTSFWDLSCHRQSGMNLNPLTLTDITCHLNEHQVFDTELRLEVIAHLRVMDQSYLSEMNKKSKQRQQANKPVKPARRGARAHR